MVHPHGQHPTGWFGKSVPPPLKYPLTLTLLLLPSTSASTSTSSQTCARTDHEPSTQDPGERVVLALLLPMANGHGTVNYWKGNQPVIQ